MREVARILKINKKTVPRTMTIMAAVFEKKIQQQNLLEHPPSTSVEFDDMETFEWTKYKPLSITLAVETKTRRILGFEVSSMPANGPLAARALQKYGPRSDDRKQAREKLLKRLKCLVIDQVMIKTDENPHYVADIRKHFPQGSHVTYKGRRGCVVGQGELKSGGFDPLFSLNHTAAMARYKMSRLVRRTWSTTKILRGLWEHLTIMVYYHNIHLQQRQQKLQAGGAV